MQRLYANEMVAQHSPQSSFHCAAAAAAGAVPWLLALAAAALRRRIS